MAGMTDVPAPRPRPGSELRAGHTDREAVAERLREAAGDGRIDLEELDERLEKAFAAKTYGDLEALVADLPGQDPAGLAPSDREPLALRTVAGDVRQDGHWVVPERITAKTTLGRIVLDFTRAECRHREVFVELDAGMGEIKVVVPRGWTVRAEGVTSGMGSVRNRATEPPVPGMPVLRISGGSKVGTIVVRHPYRWPGRRSRD